MLKCVVAKWLKLNAWNTASMETHWLNVSYSIIALAWPTAMFCLEIKKRSLSQLKKHHLPLPNLFFGTFPKKNV